MAEHDVVRDVQQGMTIARVLGYLQGQRILLEGKPHSDVAIAQVDELIEQIHQSFPSLEHLRRTPREVQP